MEVPDNILCEQCGSNAPVVTITGTHQLQGLTTWPKSTVRPDGLYVFINCSKCGEHEQCIAPPGDDKSFSPSAH